MSTRLVLRIERDGRLLGSWSLGSAPLEMTMVDVSTGRTVARFSASAESLAFVDRPSTPQPPPRRGAVDELPVPVLRLDGDDFTMPLPEPTDHAVGDVATEERPRPAAARPRNLAAQAWPEPPDEPGDGLTAELVEDTQGDTTGESEPGDGLTAELVEDTGSLEFERLGVEEDGLEDAEREDAEPEHTGLTRDLVLVDDPDIEPEELAGDGDEVSGSGHDELPVPGGDHSLPGLTAELRTATMDMPREARLAWSDGFPDDEASLTAKVPRGRLGLQTDPEQTPSALISRPARQRIPPQPAEVWAQKRGEWRSLGHLVPGQRVSTLGGWVRLAPDGRLVVHSGQSLAGTATLLDGRMIEIDNGEDFLALPPGSSVMLAVGDRGIYVRSEPLPEEERPTLRPH